MARPKSEDKRNALVAAAIRLIVAQGTGASTAAIAQQAGVSNGSLFTYFETKADLFNQLYLELKNATASAALEGMPAGAELREQMLHSWSKWMSWAVANPDHRRMPVQLGVCDEVTPATLASGHEAMAGVAELLKLVRNNGPMRKVPIGFIAAIMNALAEATMDFMIRDPAHAKKSCKEGSDAFWRATALFSPH